MIKKYMLFSQVYSRKPTQEEIIVFTKDLNRNSALLILSRLSYTKYNSIAVIQRFRKVLMELEDERYVQNFNNVIDDSVLITNQGILGAIKYILKYTKDLNQVITDKNDYEFYDIVRLILSLQDHLTDNLNVDESDLRPYFFRNILFNRKVNIKNEISRCFYMYLDKDSQVVFSELRKYYDINELFANKHGYTLLDYFIVLTSVFNLYFTTDPEKLSSSWIIDLRTYFDNVNIENIDLILNDMVGTDSDRDLWLQNSIGNPWDESFFFNHPLIKVHDRYLFSYTENSLNAQFFSSMFFKIQSCFMKKLDFNTFNGKVLEIYLNTLLTSLVSSTSKKYQYIPEFKYNKKQSDSPDMILKLGDNVLIVEVKNRKISYEGYAKGDNNSLLSSYENLMIKPLDQAIARTSEIVQGGYHKELTAGMNYYIMSVTYDTLPSLLDDYDRRNSLKDKSVINIKGLYNASIEEFEIFLEYTFRKNSKNIFRFLDRLDNDERANTILNRMIQDMMRPRLPKLVMDNIEKSYNKILDNIGGSQKNNES